MDTISHDNDMTSVGLLLMASLVLVCILYTYSGNKRPPCTCNQEVKMDSLEITLLCAAIFFIGYIAMILCTSNY